MMAVVDCAGSPAAPTPKGKPRYGRKAGYVATQTRQRNYAWARLMTALGVRSAAELARALDVEEQVVKKAIQWVRENPEPGRGDDCPPEERMPDGTLITAEEAAEILASELPGSGQTYGDVPEFRDKILARVISAN